MGSSSTKIIIPLRKKLKIELTGKQIKSCLAIIKHDIDEKKYSLYLLKSKGWKDEIIILKKDSLHERIMKEILN